MKQKFTKFRADEGADAAGRDLQYMLRMEGKVPPSAHDLEQAVLGAALLDADALPQIADILTAEMFYDDKHARIYTAILDLYNAGSKVDMLTAGNKLKAMGALSEVGGRPYLAKLTMAVGSGAHILQHAQIVFQKYLSRQIICAGSRIMRMGYDDSMDIADIIAESEGEWQKITDSIAGIRGCASMNTNVELSLAAVKRRAEGVRSGVLQGINTGLADLNAYTNGWQCGALNVLAARPAMGKTAVMLHFARTAAQQGIPAVIFSLEMTTQKLTDRLILSVSAADVDNYRSGYISDEDMMMAARDADVLRKLPITITDISNISMSRIRSICKNLYNSGKCGIVFIDYLQLCCEEATSKSGRTRDQAVSEQTRIAKNVAKELNIPVILLAQLNRELERRGGTRRPQLSDLRDSGAIEQDADIVMFLFRPEYYGQKVEDEQGNEQSNYGEIIIAKNRDGRTGLVRFRHGQGLCRIYDYDGRYDGSPPVSGSKWDYNPYESIREQESDVPF